MNLLGFLPGIIRTVGSVLNIGFLKDGADALEKAQLTPEQQASMQSALQTYELQMKQLGLEEFKTVMSESLAEITSPDRYVARARPTGLYIAYLGTAALVAANIAGVKIDTGAMVTLLTPMWSQAAWYTYNRTKEKLANGGNGGK